MFIPRLGVNVDHVATLRQARGTRYPDPVTAAAMAELAGADQITIHLREDRRHIQDRDVHVLRQTVQTKLNLEMAVTEEMAGIALEVLPDMVTLVPEKREERTTEGGLDLLRDTAALTAYVTRLKDAGIVASLFIDPDKTQIEAAVEIGAQIVELHTGDYCDATSEQEALQELEKLKTGGEQAEQLGLIVAAGHGHDYKNILPVAKLQLFEEFNIGHSIVSRAVLVGFERAVQEMIDAIALGHHSGS